MKLFLDKAHASDAQMICDPYVPGTMTFGFSEWRVLVPQGVGRWAVRRQLVMVIYVKISVPWKHTHRAGPLD